MKTVTISDIAQDEFDDAAQLITSGIKASDPKLDTRVGTVLRSLLIDPAARVEATVTRQMELLRKSTSLKAMKDAADDGDTSDASDVNAILSNFNITSSEGTKASGVVKVTVSNGTMSYSVAEGATFTTTDGLEFYAASGVTAVGEAASTGAYANTTLFEGVDSYFFLVPVVASLVGSEYNVVKGTSMTPSVAIHEMIEAEAYTAFSGGSDVADIGTTMDKIVSGLSIRGFVNKAACEGMLRDKFDGGNWPLVACSVVGYGNGAQRRDKHNLFGVGVGGRIDLYVRNFGDPYIVTKTVTGTRVEETSSYKITLSADDFPGGCWPKNVACIEDVNSPLSFTCERVADGVDDTWHDIDVSSNPSEIAGTVWQGFSITADEVPADLYATETTSTGDEDETDVEGDEDTSSSSSEEATEWSTEREFAVSVYCLPQAEEIQEYVDSDDVRSVSTDVVVRCPRLCRVEVQATVIYDPDSPVDQAEAEVEVRKYINGLGFVKTLTRSEIVYVLKRCGAVSVDLSQKNMLYGTVHDAYGREYQLSGDSLSLEGIVGDDAMLTPDTTIFVAEPEDIHIELSTSR